MQQLSGLDATFLYLETPQMPMHIGALHIFELPAGMRGSFAVALRKHMASRLPAVPVLRRKLWWMPLNLANPAWVDAEPDLKLHIVEHKLAKGAGIVELEAAVSELHAVLLDRKRPLWKYHVFEGLAPGPEGRRRVAMYSQLHHAAVDGQAAVALANATLDLSPEPRAMAARRGQPEGTFRLEMTEMLRGVIGSQAQKVAKIVRELPSTVGTLKDAAAQALSVSSLLGRDTSGVSNLTLAPRTPLNASVTDGRAFATVSLPLGAVKALGRAHGATVNDILLAICSGGLRRFYVKRRALPRKSMVAAVPITLRQKGDASADNQASMSLVSLGTHIADTRLRLAHVQTATKAMKSTMGGLRSVLPTDYPSLGMPWLIEAATALYGRARIADRIPQLANLVISNVPGPPMPLYLAGARMLTNYPASIVVHGLALNITVQSYDQSLDFGLMADAQAMPDVKDLADALRIAFEDLEALKLPGEDADDEAPSVIGRAAKSLQGTISDTLSGTVGRVARGVVDAAVEQAVSQVTGRGRKTAAKAPARGKARR